MVQKLQSINHSSLKGFFSTLTAKTHDMSTWHISAHIYHHILTFLEIKNPRSGILNQGTHQAST